MKRMLMLLKHELLNFFRNPASLVVVVLPIVISKVMISLMDLAEGQMLLLSIWVLFAQIMIGIMLVGPSLIEERESKTIDALLCTPLSYAQIIIGKSIPVVVFSLISQIIVLLINEGLTEVFPLLLVPMLLGALIFVEVGIVIGMLVSSSKNGSAVSAIVFICLFLICSVYQLLPEWSYNLVSLIPSISMVEVINGVIDEGVLLGQEFVIIFAWFIALSVYIFGFTTQRSYKKG